MVRYYGYGYRVIHSALETQYSRTARLAHVSNILRVQTHSNPLTVKTYFSVTFSGNRL